MRKKKSEPPEKTKAEPTTKLRNQVLNHFLAGTSNIEMEKRNPQLTPNMITSSLKSFWEMVFEEMENSVVMKKLKLDKQVYALARADFCDKMVGPKRVYSIAGKMCFNCYGEKIMMMCIAICKQFRNEGSLKNLKETVPTFLKDVYEKYMQLNPTAPDGSKYRNVEKPEENVEQNDEDEIKIEDESAEKKMDKSIVQEESSSNLQERVLRKSRARPPAVFRQRKDVSQRQTGTKSVKKKEPQVSLKKLPEINLIASEKKLPENILTTSEKKLPEKNLTTSEKKIPFKQVEDPEEVRSNVGNRSQKNSRKNADQKVTGNKKTSVKEHKNESTKEKAPKRKRENKHNPIEVSSNSDIVEEEIAPKKKQKTYLASQQNHPNFDISSKNNRKNVRDDEFVEISDEQDPESPKWTELEEVQIVKMIGENQSNKEIKKKLKKLFGAKDLFSDQCINLKRSQLFQTCKINFLMIILERKLVSISEMNRIEDVLDRIDWSREISYINYFIGRYEALRERSGYQKFPNIHLHETIEDMPKIKVKPVKGSPVNMKIVEQGRNVRNLRSQKQEIIQVESDSSEEQPRYTKSQARTGRRGLDNPIPVYVRGKRKTETQGLNASIPVFAKGKKTESKRLDDPIPVFAKRGSRAIRSTSKSSGKSSRQPKRKLSKKQLLKKQIEKTLRLRDQIWHGSEGIVKKKKSKKKNNFDWTYNEDE